jgi:hypothetical protein
MSEETILLDRVRAAIQATGNMMAHRESFLNDIINTAIESGHAGAWMHVESYEPAFERPGATTATIREIGDEDAIGIPTEPTETFPRFVITQATIEEGLKKFREATDIPDRGPGNWEKNLTSIPYVHTHLRDRIIGADLMNDAGTLDAADALAILEVALFNEVRYA